jgi:hypothetical protein
MAVMMVSFISDHYLFGEFNGKNKICLKIKLSKINGANTAGISYTLLLNKFLTHNL